MSTNVASQNALIDLKGKLGGRTPVRVFFLDNSSKLFLIKPDTRAKHLVRMVCEKLDMQDVDRAAGYFALFESPNGTSIERPLTPEEEVPKVVSQWGENNTEARLVFMIKLHMWSILGLESRRAVSRRLDRPVDDGERPEALTEDYVNNAEVSDPAMLHLQYLQAVYNVITGSYPVDEETALELGALHFLYKFSTYVPDRHVAGFLGARIVEFIPFRLLKAHKDKRRDQWETELFDRLATVTAEPIDNPELLYVRKVYAMSSCYGVKFFRAQQFQFRNLPEDVYLGVNHFGVMIYTKAKTLERKFRLEEIFRWGYRPNTTFYFEVKANELGSTLEFDTPHGHAVSDLLTDYALAYLAEREREELEGVEDSKEAEMPENVQDMKQAEQPTLEEAEDKVEEVEEEAQTAEDGDAMPTPPALDDTEGDEDDAKPPAAPAENGDDAGAAFSNVVEGSAEWNAVVQLQAAARGYALRTAWQKEDAAILVQSVFRGHRGRKHVEGLRQDGTAEPAAES